MHQETQLTGDTPEKTESNKGLEKAEQELASLLARKKELDKQLISVEHSIYALESAYLSETSGFGNIITGFDSYLTGRASDKRRTRIADADRLFSFSSFTIHKSLEASQVLLSDVESPLPKKKKITNASPEDYVYREGDRDRRR